MASAAAATAAALVLHQKNPLITSNSKAIHHPLFFNSPLLQFTKSPNSLCSSSYYYLLSPQRTISPPCTGVTRVTTVPVDYAPSTPDFNFLQEIARLKKLKSQLCNSSSLQERLQIIGTDSRVKLLFNASRNLFTRVLDSLNLDEYQVYLLKCLVAAGQEHVLGGHFESEFDSKSTRSSLKSALFALAEMIEKWDNSAQSERLNLRENEIQALRSLLKTLGEVEQFYNCIGGIIGYQIMVLELLAKSTQEGKAINWFPSTHNFIEIHPPNALDLSQDTDYASQAALWGIEGLPELGEIYALGGAADRLGLVDPMTGEGLPAAMLPYCGRTLLEGLIRDVQAREFLYFKLYGQQCITPVAIMTSPAKNNHERMVSLCERLRWFGRGRSSFQLFEQPLVPAVCAEDGNWIISRQFMPVCKPGGHGVIWKLAHNKGVFQWFRNHGRKGATVRQVSNVVAATDLTLLALAGIGLRQKKKLGFASCKRIAGATEGINVLMEKKRLDGNWEYGLTCVEYTEFDKFGIVDGPLPSNRLQTDFPANTNILYIDLPSVERIGSSNNDDSLPGMVLNTKKPVTYEDQFGMTHCVSGGRPECTMQNIADSFSNTFPSRYFEGSRDELDTYIVYNERRKVTSSAKRKRRHGNKSLHQTPDGSLLDVMRNAYDLLSHCDISIPKILDNEHYADSGPPFLILLHPALGPLWEVTRQKFHGGLISKGSELQIEVAEILWKNVQLDGSLIILAENAMGAMTIDETGETVLQYGKRCGRCKLENIKVINRGIDWTSQDNIYWKHDVQRLETVKIVLHGNAEFEAVDITLQGNHVFEVPDGYKMKITSQNSGLSVGLNPIEENLMDCGSWFWNYKLKGSHIQLELVEL